jgi:hypothetical protein
MGKLNRWITAFIMCARRSGAMADFIQDVIADIPEKLLSDEKVRGAVERIGRSVVIPPVTQNRDPWLDFRRLRPALAAYAKVADGGDLTRRAEKVCKRIQRARPRTVRPRKQASPGSDDPEAGWRRQLDRSDPVELREFVRRVEASEQRMPPHLADATFDQLRRWVPGQWRPPEGTRSTYQPVKKTTAQRAVDHAGRARQSKLHQKGIQWLVDDLSNQ